MRITELPVSVSIAMPTLADIETDVAEHRLRRHRDGHAARRRDAAGERAVVVTSPIATGIAPSRYMQLSLLRRAGDAVGAVEARAADVARRAGDPQRRAVLVASELAALDEAGAVESVNGPVCGEQERRPARGARP